MATHPVRFRLVFDESAFANMRRRAERMTWLLARSTDPLWGIPPTERAGSGPHVWTGDQA